MEAKKINLQQAMALVWDGNKWKHQNSSLAVIEKMMEERRKRSKLNVDLL